MELTLNTVRKIDYDQTREFAFGDKKSLEEHLAIAFLHPRNMKDLNLRKDAKVKISNEAGSIVVEAQEDEKVPVDSILLPVSIWANQITRVQGTEISYKNIKVIVDATNEPITKYEDIINKIKGD